MCRNLKLLLMFAAASTATLTLFAPASRAVPIGGLCDTGVDNSGVPFASPNVADAHYSLNVSPQASTAVTVDDTNYPFSSWLPNTPTASWQQSPELGTAPLASIGVLISIAFLVRQRTTSRSGVAMS
jgi:hypothetical protein